MVFQFLKNFLYSPFAKPSVPCGPLFAFDHNFLKHVFHSKVILLMRGKVFDNFQKVWSRGLRTEIDMME